MNDVAEAEDVLQESFTEAFKNLHSFEYRTSFGGWLKQICINRSINQLKKRKVNWVDIDATDTYNYPEETVIDENEIRLKVEAVKKSIMKLPDGYRTVLTLYLLEGYDHEEIAEILNVADINHPNAIQAGQTKIITTFKRGDMSRKLEKFIGDHRNEFDDRIPSDKVWENLEAGLAPQQPQQQKKSILRSFE